MTFQNAATNDASMPDDIAPPLQEWNADFYQSNHSFVWEFGSSLVDLVMSTASQIQQQQLSSDAAANATTPITLLDIGCGTGHLTHELFQRWTAAAPSTAPPVTVVGIDADPHMIASAQQQFPHLDFRVDDARTLSSFSTSNTTTSPVDIIISNAALHWIPQPDHPRLIQSASRLLRDGTGTMVVEFGGHGNVAAVVEYLEQATGKANPWYFPTVAEYTTLLEQHGGFEIRSAELYDRPTPLQQDESKKGGGGVDGGLRNWIRMFGSHFLADYQEDEESLARLLEDAEQALRLKLYDETKKQWIADYRRIRIIAKKV